MKFGQDYQVALSRGEYPQDWIESAISYKKLKKCIKRVQQELISLGLDKDTLNELWQNVGPNSNESTDEQVLQYSLQKSGKIQFTPKLTIAIDPHDGSPMDAWLSPDTRRVLRRLVNNDQLTTTASGQGAHAQADNDSHRPSIGDFDSASDAESVAENEAASTRKRQHTDTIEVPLTSDSEFFQILRRELTELDQLQAAEQQRIQDEITELGNELQKLKVSRKKRSKQELETWRNIFEMYQDAEIFSSMHEADAGDRDSAQAQKHFEQFNKAMAPQREEIVKLGQLAGGSLDRFLRINVKLLRLIKFQEINKTALTKIMKKFDKRTSLHTQATIQNSLTKAPFLAENLARATCFTITNELLNLIPQLNDYLCPICFSISWKPVRLKCNHVFCIRCLIVLQRQRKPHCPLCREVVVMEADNGKPHRGVPAPRLAPLSLIFLSLRLFLSVFRTDSGV